MKVLWASSWGVFAALTDAVHSPHNQFFEKNRQSNCGTRAKGLGYGFSLVTVTGGCYGSIDG
jgi:hypothetical protein